MGYIEDYFKEMGFEVQEVEPQIHIPLVNVFRITKQHPVVTTFFRWESAKKDDKFFLQITHKIRSILLRGIKFDGDVYDYERLQNFVDSYYPNLTPDEKVDNILEYLSRHTLYAGQRVALKPPEDNDSSNFFYNQEEWYFFRRTCIELGLIEEFDGTMSGEGFKYRLTILGLKRILSIKEKSESKICFVAMSFDKELEFVYQEAIAAAIIYCGFQPYIVSKIDIDSDVTINDAILAGIKKARFTIVDFTKHKQGVYFEAGYALGRGQKVIYTCKDEDLKGSHFDTRNYQHIVWSDVSDLKQKLINKIDAFIKD